MIILDVETTGLDPKRHSIVSVGALDFSQPSNEFYRECRIWAGAEVDKAALQVNGFTEASIRDPGKPSLEALLIQFWQWLQTVDERTIAGENPSFDRDFLLASAERYTMDFQLGYRTVDLHSLCYCDHLRRGIAPPIKNGRSDLNLDRILAHLGLPAEPTPHHAMVGAKLEAEAFSRLVRGEGLLEEFAGKQTPNGVGGRD